MSRNFSKNSQAGTLLVVSEIVLCEIDKKCWLNISGVQNVGWLLNALAKIKVSPNFPGVLLSDDKKFSKYFALADCSMECTLLQ